MSTAGSSRSQRRLRGTDDICRYNGGRTSSTAEPRMAAAAATATTTSATAYGASLGGVSPSRRRSRRRLPRSRLAAVTGPITGSAKWHPTRRRSVPRRLNYEQINGRSCNNNSNARRLHVTTYCTWCHIIVYMYICKTYNIINITYNIIYMTYNMTLYIHKTYDIYIYDI